MDNTTGTGPPKTLTGDQMLQEDLKRILGDAEMEDVTANDSRHMSTLKIGLRVLMRHPSIPLNQTWEDAIDYTRAVIVSPRDDGSRAAAGWNRSCSDLSKELLSRFGPGSIQAARDGCTSLIADHYGGRREDVAHIDKKANFIRNWRNQTPGNAFYPASSILARACYESGSLICAMVLVAWGTNEQAVKLGSLAHPAVCDDYSKFTGTEYAVRIRMLALAMGAAYEFGDCAAHALIDSSLPQCQGTGTDTSIESIMAWRAVSGVSVPYSEALFGRGGVEENVVSPIVIMAMHDLYDWRCDAAAGNHENGVSGVYGLGVKDPFHLYLETVLEMAVKYPIPGVYAISAITFMHFTAARYGSYEYRGTHQLPCSRCIELLRVATNGTGLAWVPKPPPESFAEGTEIRRAAKALMDLYDDQGLVQESASWFQYLILTGKIRLFDMLAEGVQPVDVEVGWT